MQFQEGASLAGINYFVVVMDEEVQMIRPPGPPEREAERAETRDAYQAFRDRHELGRPTDRGWLDQERPPTLRDSGAQDAGRATQPRATGTPTSPRPRCAAVARRELRH